MTSPDMQLLLSLWLLPGWLFAGVQIARGAWAKPYYRDWVYSSLLGPLLPLAAAVVAVAIILGAPDE
ncbi:MAG: hypothetical protein P1U65_07490 [Minwuia sp.]|nr:hypothetical protein [Minwuia sp.]